MSTCQASLDRYIRPPVEPANTLLIRHSCNLNVTNDITTAKDRQPHWAVRMALEFATTFKALTDKEPFPWQTALYENWFSQGKIPPAATLPTGLGKTSVIAICLIALANKCNVPCRLVYVVNRRTVVDQTTEEVEKYLYSITEDLVLLEAFHKIGFHTPKPPLRHTPFAASTLRGQFADNREWSADPSRPAVICGTVDMIGSRLLFSGYGIGRGSRPLHAGFLGQDALLIHDEAHLEPAFQTLLESIVAEQDRCKEFGTFRVMELTATSRGEGKPFELTEEEKAAPSPLPPLPTSQEEWEKTEPIHLVWWRTHSKKSLTFIAISDEKKELAQQVAACAEKYIKDAAEHAVLIFVRTVEAVGEVVKALTTKKVVAKQIETLTGTMRGFERDAMARTNKVFARFKSGMDVEPQPGTVFFWFALRLAKSAWTSPPTT